MMFRERSAFVVVLAALVSGAFAGPCLADQTTHERIVLIRHGEKPQDGLGQLNCQGLNRALALPAVIQQKFGKPDAIFAPNPSDQKNDRGKLYDYVRPLATIEPTAIALGMPIHSSIGISRMEALETTLMGPEYHSAFVLVAWEHTDIVAIAGALMKANQGDAKSVPAWASPDFDSIYIVDIDWTGKTGKATFSQDSQGLNGRSETCPR